MSMKKIGNIVAHKLFGLISPEPMYEPIPVAITKVSDADGVKVFDLVYADYTVRLTITKDGSDISYTREVTENV